MNDRALISMFFITIMLVFSYSYINTELTTIAGAGNPGGSLLLALFPWLWVFLIITTLVYGVKRTVE